MLYIRISACILTLIFFVGPASAQMTATEIIRKADESTRGETSQSELSITTIRPDWTREMTVKSWSSGDQYALLLVTSPARDKGTVYLKRSKEVWNWIPSIERTVKLPPSMMAQNWMGTDFTNDDLVQESSIVKDYEHTLGADTVINGRSCWHLILDPKPDAAVVWGEVHSWVDQKDYVVVRSEFYDEDDFLVNTIVFSDIKDFGPRKLATKMEMIPEDKPGHRTVITYSNVVFDEPIEEKFFTTGQMRRLRP